MTDCSMCWWLNKYQNCSVGSNHPINTGVKATVQKGRAPCFILTQGVKLGTIMASITFPIVKHTIRASKPPPTQNQWNFYAQIRCEGPTGEVLFLIYIRPDRLNLDETTNGKPALANSYDPVSKVGVAYFPAWKYTWHKAMFGRKNVCAQVDDIYPYSNHIFTDVTRSLTSLDPVPDVVAWFKQHPNVDNALTWLDSSYNKKSMATARPHPPSWAIAGVQPAHALKITSATIK